MATTIKKDPIVDYVVTEFTRYEAHWKKKFDEALSIYDHWMNKAPKRQYSWQNAVHVPVTVEAEQTITPRLFTALFPTDAPLDVHVEGDAPPEQGIRIKSIIQHYFRVANAQSEAWPALSQATLLGTGYLEGGSWYVKRGWQIDEFTYERYEALIESRPDVKYCDFFEMFPHPHKLRMDDGLPLIRKRYCDAEALKRLGDNPNFRIKNLNEALQSDPPFPRADDKKGEEYEILEYWGPWDASYTDKSGKVVTKKAVPFWGIVVNRAVMIRWIENPYNHQMPPFIKVILFPDPKPNWFGIGQGKIGLPTQERLNKLVNQRLDNVDLVINKQGVFSGHDTMINAKRLLVSEPGKWHKVSDVNASIKPWEFNDVTASSYKEEELAKADYRESTGATAHLMPAGTPKEQHRTAMGIQLLQGAAGMRFRPVLRKLETDLIQGLAMFFFSNLKQFMTHAEWVLVTGKDGATKPVQITPEQIQAKVFFIPTGISETMNKEVQVGQLLRFKEITMNDPTVNRTEINKRIAELFGFKDIEKLLVPQQQAQPGATSLPQQTQQIIQQRLREGASPDQIKEELLGPRPEPQPAGAA